MHFQFHKHYPDWSLLPTELLQTISQKVVTSLADYADHIRFRAVCHRWRSALSPRPLHLLHQFPWLMIPYPCSSGDGDDDVSACLFYDLCASKFHFLDLPETRGFKIRGSSHGWLILCKDLQLSLLNPITRAVITLPKFTGPPFPLGIAPPDVPDGELFFQNWDSDQYAMKPTSVFLFFKAILTSSPLDPGCLVFIHSCSLWQMSFCKIGDDHWTVVEFKYHLPLDFQYIYDFTYINGCLYTINGVGTVTMYDLNTPSRVIFDCSVRYTSYMHLVDGSSPEILLVVHVPEAPESETEYMVYKLSNAEEHKWIEVRDIGRNVLFVTGGRNAIFLPSADLQLPGWGANCLCCDSTAIERYYQGQSSVALFKHRIKLARLDDGKITAKTRDLGSFQSNHWLKSLWLTPSFN